MLIYFSVNDFKLPPTIVEENKDFNKILAFCKDNNLDVTFFIAPFCPQVQNIDYVDKLKTKIPALLDYSRLFSIQDKTLYFSDCNHLSGKGADIFTEVFFTDLEKR